MAIVRGTFRGRINYVARWTTLLLRRHRMWEEDGTCFDSAQDRMGKLVAIAPQAAVATGIATATAAHALKREHKHIGKESLLLQLRN